MGGTEDVYLIKTDSNGDSVWTKTFDRTNSEESGNSVQQTLDSGYVICGGVYNHILQDEEVYLIKTDFAGNLLWAKSFGGANDDIGFSVQQTTTGGYISCGLAWSFGAGSSDIYLNKTDLNGNLQISKTYGGVSGDFAKSVQQTTDGGYVVTGYSYSLGTGNSDVFLMRLNSNLDTLWTRVFGGTGNENGTSVKQTNDGGFIITGYKYNFGANSPNIYLIKTDSLGNSNCNQGSIVFNKTSLFNTSNPALPFVASSLIYMTIPATIVGSGGIVTTLCTTGIQSQIINHKSEIFISPNPSTGKFTISFAGNFDKGEIEIYNAFGEKIFSEEINNEKQKAINLKNIAEGIYFVKIFDGEKYFCKKIVIEKD